MTDILEQIRYTFINSPLIIKCVLIIGGFFITRLILGLVFSLYTIFLRPSKKTLKFGQWGIVTGATDGIGKALAMELARKGLNVVLISRTQKKLEETRDDILSKYPNIQVKILVIDFTQIQEKEEQDSITQMIAEIGDIGVLFNNVGVSYDFPQYFEQLPMDRIESLVTLNVLSVVFMTKFILPGMLERKRGVIVNISSGSARIVAPLLAEYGATKKFVENFTASLAKECIAKNVHIQCHTPMFVTTKLAKIRHSSFLIPTPAKYARAAVSNLGYETIISPYWPHALQIWIYESIPNSIMSMFAMRVHLDLRKRALKKMAMKKSE